ncbi:hypothetical protein N431DRAFT_511898 [Stipitochalara longipes BDJ]|nr:hypothetical protein N431DRAFT_511898 [Stipitochalara longipes BDJ]
MAPCRFFAGGTCIYGSSCRNSHIFAPPNYTILSHPATRSTGTEQSPQGSTSEPPAAPEKPYTPLFPDNQATGLEQSLKPAMCPFFARGFCRNGESCRYVHERLSLAVSAPLGENRRQEQQAGLLRQSSSRVINEYTRNINGAQVTYGAGAEVANVELASDFSRIEIYGLPANANSNTVRNLLSDLGHTLDGSIIVFRTSVEGVSVAEVRVDDYSFARDIISKLELTGHRDIVIKEITGTAENGTLSKKIQLSTVNCTWYQPSRLAWLVYSTEADATRVVDTIRESKILGRALNAAIRESNYVDGKISSCIVYIRDKLFGCNSPESITLGDPTYQHSDGEAAQLIRERLEAEAGCLDSFHYRLVPGSSKVKATATFLEKDAAATAVWAFHNTSIDALANTKLFVSHIVSVKYNISTLIITAMKEDLDKLAEDFMQDGHVQLRIYSHLDPSKSYTTLRLFWENLKNVSGAKIRLEKLLAGVVVLKSEEPLWDNYFSTFAALHDLTEIGTAHNVYIFRDSRKCRLVMYGGTIDARNEVQQILVKKVDEFHTFEHILILTPHLLRLAIQGGMKRLKSKFGDAVSLRVGFNSSTITITGSAEDFRDAQALLPLCAQTHEPGLVTSPQAPAQTAAVCVICWTVAAEPLHIACNHVYCIECFHNQASSATEAELPLRCFGSDGTCQQICTFDELKKMLSSSTFESLLRNSFDSHTRTRPNDFQYCPTPDCPQIYRPSTNGHVFYCSTCLTPICTTCNVISHDGMTCRQWQEMGTEDGRLLRQYKEENDVRECPNCGVGIEKNEGCNHIECRQCGAHICWFCMDMFAESEGCYEHMRNRHGNIYDDDDD